MKWSDANEVVEALRRDTRLYLPALTQRRGFSSSRVEHLLNGLVRAMPPTESYFEVGVLEGRTLEAAAAGNDDKRLAGCDPGIKYNSVPVAFGGRVQFFRKPWQYITAEDLMLPVGVAFYDGDHSAGETREFIRDFQHRMADEAVLVLDDWDRENVRAGAFMFASETRRWRLLREMPEYTDGLTTAPHHFGYYFGVAVWGFRR